MDKPNDKETVKEFCKIMQDQITERFGDSVSMDNIIYHLVEKGKISPRTVRDTVIIHEYRAKYEYQKDITMQEIGYKYDLCAKQVKRILTYPFNKFNPRANIA